METKGEGPAIAREASHSFVIPRESGTELRLFAVLTGQERRRELGLAPAFAALAVTTGTTIATLSAAFAARTAMVTVTVIATGTTILTRLARRTRVGQLLAGFLVDEAHRQADLAALVDLEQL